MTVENMRTEDMTVEDMIAEYMSVADIIIEVLTAEEMTVDDMTTENRVTSTDIGMGGHLGGTRVRWVGGISELIRYKIWRCVIKARNMNK